MDAKKLNALDITEYNLIANKDPKGSYDRQTRENLYNIIKKLSKNSGSLSRLETKLYRKFRHAQFAALNEKDKKVKLEVARYQISSKMKQSLKTVSLLALTLIVGLAVIYQFILPDSARHQVDVAYFASLHKLGLVSQDEVKEIAQNLEDTEKNLEKTKKEYQELAQMVDQMIANNQVAENLKYIVKRIYNDPRTRYVRHKDEVDLIYDGRRIARYSTDPEKWYLLGIVDSGVIRVFYNDEELMVIESIFGRKGEETPLGEYQIKNKIYKPTWYKKEDIEGRTKVRVIPFGDPDHEIGYWWMGLKRLGPKVPGSYGIHGVNAGKSNEFFKKNFDWRNGSAGCPNIQAWNLEFLARVVPKGTRVNIVQKDKWAKASLDRDRTA